MVEFCVGACIWVSSCQLTIQVSIALLLHHHSVLWTNKSLRILRVGCFIEYLLPCWRRTSGTNEECQKISCENFTANCKILQASYSFKYWTISEKLYSFMWWWATIWKEHQLYNLSLEKTFSLLSPSLVMMIMTVVKLFKGKLWDEDHCVPNFMI